MRSGPEGEVGGGDLSQKWEVNPSDPTTRL